MTTEQSWDLTPREFASLERLYIAHLERWALERADYRNAHLGKDDTPWIPDDFLHSGGRQQRKRDHQMELIEVARENARLAKIGRNAPEEAVPAWALAQKKTQPNGR